MKKLTISLLLALAIPACWSGSGQVAATNLQPPATSVVEGATLSMVIDALAEYTGMTKLYIHDHFVGWQSYGVQADGEETGTITVNMSDGPQTWNWRCGSNIMVIWPA